ILTPTQHRITIFPYTTLFRSYIDNFAGNIKGVQEKLSYIEKCNVNYVHLMPFLDSPKGRSDGGYAVADFRKVKPELGTMEDLSRSEEHTSELQSRFDLVCRLL